jgi:putative ABC transport system permease protein
MLRNYIKIALRNLRRQPLYSGINLASLSVGIAATLLVGLWVQNELRFDQYHQRVDRIYRIVTDLRLSPTETWYWASTPLKITELATQVPGIEQAAQLKSVPQIELALWRGPMSFLGKNPIWVSQNWFKTFDFKIKEGSVEVFFEKPTHLLLTEKKAREIFGDHPAVGQTLRMDTLDYMVCGVLADPSPQSSFQFEVMLPIGQDLMDSNERKNAESWNNFNYSTFVELHPGADPKTVANSLTQLLVAAKQDSNIVLGLQPLADLHFDTKYQDEFRKGNRSTVYAFAVIGLLLLGMACINYVSLTTARAAARAREIGIKKMNGAQNNHIFGQIMAESALLATFSAALALVLIQFSMPFFNRLTEQEFRFEVSSPLGLSLLGGTLVVALVLSGFYPAWLLSRFQPLEVMRSQGSGLSGRSLFRQGLVVVQFAISSALLVSTIVIWQQRQYIQNKPLGYERDNTFTFQMSWTTWRSIGQERAVSVRNTLEQMLERESSISKVVIGSQSPVLLESTHSGSVEYDGKPADAKPTVSQLSADPEYADLFGLQMPEGRWFSDSKADESNVVINETAARELNLKQPWVGQSFGFQGKKGQVIGVVKDFHFLSLHKKITPLVIHNAPDWRFHFFVKAQAGDLKSAIAAAESHWKTQFPNHPFKYNILDDQFEQLYGNERRAGELFNVFAGLAIFISCMGLFGLAVFMAGQRTKEIGIRKVLGASVAGITGLLAKDFLRLVVIAIVIASPIAYYFMNKWLADFAYRIDMQWWMFAGAGAAAVLIAFLTVGFQSAKAALANPVKSLRSE